MKNILSLFFFVCSIASSFAQKKMTPISQSPLTGISLPAGSKQDSRMLSTAAAKMLLEMESKKVNITISSPEVLTLPPVTAGGFNADSLVKNLSDKGWVITVIEGDKKYAWLKKDSRNLIMYFSMDAKETGLYFAEAASAPVQNGQGNNTGTIQTAPTETNQTQQTTNTVIQTNQPEVVQTNQTEIVQQPTPPVTNSGFAFTTINFDDGWTSTVQEDWVEVTKGNIKVLLHYPKAGTIFPADPEPMTNAAWDILVAPRYSNLKNYLSSYIATFERPHIAMGYLTEKASGKNVFVVFFHRGSSVWMEFVAPDKNAFIQQYKFDPETIKWDSDDALLNPLLNMQGYNKFAVAASDFKGKWTSDFTGISQMYNVYTGLYAGMRINQSNEEFVFSGNTYNWKLLVVNGMAGNANFNEVKSTGKLTVPNNWQVHFSMIETRARTYHAFWSCIKGARILNLLDADYPGSGIYTKYGLAK